MHNEVKRFGLSGTINSDNFVQAKDTLIHELESSMRDEGFVPVLDLIPQFTREYDPVSEVFSFELSVYGAYVGEQAWQIEGIANGVSVLKSTHRTK